MIEKGVTKGLGKGKQERKMGNNTDSVVTHSTDGHK
jgi:hypothetical protein